ncbi:MAG: tail fiber protein [Phyllobacteriaceae bacterium]|nr:tail fiber protein [Phyllobacteriaceae bacterium]
MSEPFVGEIRMFAGNFAPRGWAFCDGQLLAVSQNDALFSLLGTIYGGDGRTTFGLPDLRGRIPIHAGQGPGLSQRRLGAKAGAENVTLTVNQLPSHTHTYNASTTLAGANSPQDALIGESPTIDLFSESTPTAGFSASAITHTGGSRSHTNLQPFLCVNFIIALFGIYPSRH